MSQWAFSRSLVRIINDHKCYTDSEHGSRIENDDGKLGLVWEHEKRAWCLGKRRVRRPLFALFNWRRLEWRRRMSYALTGIFFIALLTAETLFFRATMFAVNTDGHGYSVVIDGLSIVVVPNVSYPPISRSRCVLIFFAIFLLRLARAWTRKWISSQGSI